MKPIKFIIGTILVLLILLFIGEIHAWSIINFEEKYPYTTMYLQKETSSDEMIIDITAAAQRYNVEFFAVETTYEDLVTCNIVVYSSVGAADAIAGISDVKAGSYNSIFLGKINIDIKMFGEISDMSDVSTYYMIGAQGNIVGFKQSLIDKYAGKYPQFPSGGEDDRITVGLIWAVVLSFLILLTNFEIALVKREITVRVILGERLSGLVLQHIFKDVLYYSVLFGVSAALMNIVTNITYCKEVSLTCIVIFLFVNSSSYFKFYIMDYKKDIATQANAKNIMRSSYVFKMASIVITMVIMAGNIGLVMTGIDFYKQHDFFYELKEYSYQMIGSWSKSDEQLYEAYAYLYDNPLRTRNVISLVDIGDWGIDDDGITNKGKVDNYILANNGAVPYLSKQIPELQYIYLDSIVYFLLPDDKEDDGTVLDIAKRIFGGGYHKGEYEYEVLTYKSDARVISISIVGKVESAIAKNPIIILNNIGPENFCDGYVFNSSMFRLTKSEFNNMIDEIDYTDEVHYQTNVYDNYISQWEIVRSALFAGAVFFFLLLFLEAIIIRTILYYEYSMNATELVLKKILGYSIFEKQKKIFLMTSAGGIVSVIASVIICNTIVSESAAYVAVGGTIILAVELTLIVWYTRKMELMSSERFLKGGRL